MDRIDFPVLNPAGTLVLARTRDGIVITRFIDIEGGWEVDQYVYDIENEGGKAVKELLWDIIEELWIRSDLSESIIISTGTEDE